MVSESSLTGDLVPYNGSTISFALQEHSAWTGAAYAGYGAVGGGHARLNAAALPPARHSTDPADGR